MRRLVIISLLAAACGSDPAGLRPADRTRTQLTVSPPELVFGLVDVGDGLTDDVVVVNQGVTDVVIDVVTIEGAGRMSFSVRPDETIKIGGERSKRLTVTFAPREGGEQRAELVLFHNGTGDPVRVPISGGGRACVDADQDGFGEGCIPGNDCRDDNASINPGAMEVCDGEDNNCDGTIDEGFATETYYRDADGDGFGTDTVPPLMSCMAPNGFVSRVGDCRDDIRAINPDANEACTGGLDEDCDTLIDQDDPDCQVPDAGVVADTGPAPDSGVVEGDAGPPDAGPPTACQTQDDCGLNTNGLACPLLGLGNDMCAPVCRRKTDCAAGEACRPLGGTASLGFCQTTTGTLAVGSPCTAASLCDDGICVQGACRSLCQKQADCGSGDICGIALYNTIEIGGRDSRRLTSVCRPVGARRPLGQTCNIDQNNVDTGLCAAEHCDLPPWSAWGASSGILGSPNATCAPLCASSGDCGAGQVCGLVYNGLAEVPTLPPTGESFGRYHEAVLGCYTPFFRVNALRWDPQPPGQGGLNTICDPNRAEGRLVCRSHLCAQFQPIRGRCTDFCQNDRDCQTPSTPNWRCRYGELSLTGLFLQDYDIADITKFTLVSVCAP